MTRVLVFSYILPASSVQCTDGVRTGNIKLPYLELLGFGRATRPSDTRTRLLRLINMQTERCHPPPPRPHPSPSRLIACY
jgi:hypothetical protein